MGQSRTSEVRRSERLPLPLAQAWQRVRVATNPSQRGAEALEAFRAVIRTILCLLLADYLRGAPHRDADAALERLGRPTDGDMVTMLRQLAAALRGRETPAPFVPDLLAWLLDDTTQTPAAWRALDHMVQLRNRRAHRLDTQERAAEFARALRGLVLSLEWLEPYQMFEVLGTQGSDLGGPWVRVHLRLLRGTRALNLREPLPVRWHRALGVAAGRVYIAGPDADELLDLRPLMRVVRVERTNDERLLLLQDAKDWKWIRWRGVGDDVMREQALDDDAPGVGFARMRSRLQGHVWMLRRPADQTDPLLAPEPTSKPLLPGHLELGPEIGRGGMAAVHRARHRLTGADVAIKVIDSPGFADARLVERFVREATTMSRLNHPRVIRILEVGRLNDGRPYFTMPLATRTVRDALREGPPARETTIRWASQVLDALAYLHGRAVTHRDLKPENLLLDAEEQVLVADFGIALDRHQSGVRLTSVHERVGSTQYMSPEQLGRTGTSPGPASDVYSAALILHELLTGRLPSGQPGSDLDDPLGPLVLRMGSPEPEHRPSARVCADALARAAAATSADGPLPAALSPGWAPVVQPETGLRPALLDLALPTGQRLWVAQTPVTQAQFASIMGRQPSWFGSAGAEWPVESVSAYDACHYCNLLSRRAGLDPAYRLAGRTIEPLGGRGYRLPTPQEWAWLATGEADPDAVTRHGHRLVETRTVAKSSGSPSTHSTRAGTAGLHGLVDLWGNVQEWCLGENQAVFALGGSWAAPDGPWVTPRSPADRSREIGFRIVCHREVDGS